MIQFTLNGDTYTVIEPIKKIYIQELLRTNTRIVYNLYINGNIVGSDRELTIPTNKEFIGFTLSPLGTRLDLPYNVMVYCDINYNITYYSLFKDIEGVESGITLTLYQNFDEIFKVNKAINPIGQLSGTLRENCSMENPSILVEITGTIIPNFNYVYIPQFKKYYFVRSKSFFRNNLWNIDLKEDVLMTFKNTIYENTGLISRQANEYNNDLIDTERLVETDFSITLYDMGETLFTPSKYTDDPSSSTPTYDSKNIIVITAEWLVYPSYMTDYTDIDMDKTTEEQHGDALFSTAFNSVYLVDTHTFKDIEYRSLIGGFDVGTAETKIYNNPSEYLLSFVSYPFELDDWLEGYDTYVCVGSTRLQKIIGTGDIEGKIVTSSKQRFFTYTINRYFNDFMDFAPYTKIKMYLPYIDIIDLPVNEVMGKTLKIGYVIDFNSATLHANIIVVEGSTEKLLMTASGKVGVELPIGRTNATDRARNKQIDGINRAVGVANTALSSLGSFAEGKVGKGASGLIGGIINYLGQQKIDAITNNQEIYSGGKISGDFNGMFLPQRAFLLITRPKPIPIDENYYHIKGKPLGEYRTLSMLQGFTIVDDIHLTGFTDATDDEIKEIENLLRTGVHL